MRSQDRDSTVAASRPPCLFERLCTLTRSGTLLNTQAHGTWTDRADIRGSWMWVRRVSPDGWVDKWHISCRCHYLVCGSALTHGGGCQPGQSFRMATLARPRLCLLQGTIAFAHASTDSLSWRSYQQSLHLACSSAWPHELLPTSKHLWRDVRTLCHACTRGGEEGSLSTMGRRRASIDHACAIHHRGSMLGKQLTCHSIKLGCTRRQIQWRCYHFCPPARQHVHAAAQPRHSSASTASRTRAVQPREEESSAVSCQELRRWRGTIAVRCTSTLMGCGSPQSWLEKAAPEIKQVPAWALLSCPLAGRTQSFAEATSALESQNSVMRYYAFTLLRCKQKSQKQRQNEAKARAAGQERPGATWLLSWS